MTVEDIYRKSKAWMFEKLSSTIYNDYIIEITNKVLAELYEENNMCRAFNNKKPFTDGVSKHQVELMTDELDYEEEYLYDVIPKGIDSYFLMDDDLQKKGILDTEYNNARVFHQKLVSSEKIAELLREVK